MCTGLECLHYLIFCNNCPHGKPISQRLCKAHDIWLYIVVFVSKEFARSSNAGLNFIEDKKDVFFSRKISEFFNISFICKINTAFCLYKFNNNRTCLVVRRFYEAFYIVERYVFETTRKRRKAFLKFCLPCCRECCQCTSVKRIFHCDYFVSFCTVFFP
ncbi:MAG: hypothetical protein BWX58_00525 [Deltaproteobacteria bacterium ADurb.Bin026]|nr:MAG: hypothetical protein BWX58_00525 [Deltaproteobacteria bacterium ADurb.Bin026]